VSEAVIPAAVARTGPPRQQKNENAPAQANVACKRARVTGARAMGKEWEANRVVSQ